MKPETTTLDEIFADLRKKGLQRWLAERAVEGALELMLGWPEDYHRWFRFLWLCSAGFRQAIDKAALAVQDGNEMAFKAALINASLEYQPPSACPSPSGDLPEISDRDVLDWLERGDLLYEESVPWDVELIGSITVDDGGLELSESED